MPSITDLTGCTWVGNSVVGTADDSYFYYINFISNNTSFIRFILDPNADREDTIWYTNVSGNYEYVYDNNTYPPKENGWENDAYRTILITGGTDATNSNLIAWLQNNGTLTLPDLSNTHWKLNNNITFTNVGTKSINFKSGNTNFSSITISGSDGLKYGNTTIVEAPTTITVSFTNSVDTWTWQWTKIFKDYTISNSGIYVNSSDEVGSISSYNGSTTVYTDSDKLVILEYSATVNGTESCGTLTLTGGLTNTGLQSCYTEHTGELANVDKIYLDNTPVGGQWTNNFLGYTFAVSGSGTISINGADMDD